MPRALRNAVIAAALVPAALAAADEVGYEELVARLGSAAPNGASVSVAQVEAQESAGNFGPNRALAEFAGKTFTDMSGPSGSSGHATFVGQNMYGGATSIARGVLRIWTYEAGSWAQGAYLNVGNSAALPSSPGARFLRLLGFRPASVRAAASSRAAGPDMCGSAADHQGGGPCDPPAASLPACTFLMRTAYRHNSRRGQSASQCGRLSGPRHAL